MATTSLLDITLLEQAQQNAYLTANEGFWRLMAASAAIVKDRDLTAPPGSPVDGDVYIPASGATGAWAAKDLNVAFYLSGAWLFIVPFEGMTLYVQDENQSIVYDGASWVGALGEQSVVARDPSGASTIRRILYEEHTLAAAATSDTAIEIPDRAIVEAVSVRVSEAITGATSFDVGVAGNTGQFGGGIGAGLGQSNVGVIGPTAFYADTPIRLTANGGNFSGGRVKVAIHLSQFSAPDA